jgi:hypothetical protein
LGACRIRDPCARALRDSVILRMPERLTVRHHGGRSSLRGRAISASPVPGRSHPVESAPFDQLSRLVGQGATRRALLELAAALGLSPLLVDAKKRRKKNKKKCKGGTKKCGKRCIPSNQCCRHGDCPAAAPRCCQGACLTVECCTSADCRGGKTCPDGTCACPPERPLCPDVSTEVCCAPTPGYEVSQIICGSAGPTPICGCTYPAVGNCAPGCTATDCSLRGDCSNPPSRETLCGLCGCSPP